MKKLLFYCFVFVSLHSGILFSSEIEQRFHSLYLSNKDQLYAESKRLKFPLQIPRNTITPSFGLHIS